jgi:hypothetical protein
MMSLPRFVTFFLISGVSMPAPLPSVFASELLKSEALRATLSDNTIQGSMTKTGPYSEYYQPDGTIKGESYTGKWRVEGDNACFIYNQPPEDCWGMTRDGDHVEWMKDGQVLGTGTVHRGNVNKY